MVGVDGAQVRLFDKVSLWGFLEGHDCRRLEEEIALEVLGDFTCQTLEGHLAYEELGALLVTMDLTVTGLYLWGFCMPPLAWADLWAALVDTQKSVLYIIEYILVISQLYVINVASVLPITRHYTQVFHQFPINEQWQILSIFSSIYTFTCILDRNHTNAAIAIWLSIRTIWRHIVSISFHFSMQTGDKWVSYTSTVCAL